VNVDAQGGTPSAEADLPVNKTGKVLNPVQDGLNLKLNSWSPGSGFAVFEQPQTTRTAGDQLFVSGRGDPQWNLPQRSPRRSPCHVRRAPRRHPPMGVEPPRAGAKRRLFAARGVRPGEVLREVSNILRAIYSGDK
jgi:hypothetical protein